MYLLKGVWYFGTRLWLVLGCAMIVAVVAVALLLCVHPVTGVHIAVILGTPAAHAVSYLLDAVVIASLLLYGCEVPRCRECHRPIW